MSGEYVPTMEVIERAYVSMSTSGMPVLSRTTDEERMLARKRFRKALATHDARIASEAAERGWDEGCEWGRHGLKMWDAPEPNPYRADRMANEREGGAE